MQGQPFGYGYEPPSGVERGRPAVITWFRVYAATTVLLYVGMLVAWLAVAANGPAMGGAELALVLLIFGVVVLLFGGLFAVAAMVPYKPWGWTVGLVAICLGLTSCMAVAAIPLLIYWMKPETKAAFGRL
ncbi:MAG: hypothetical protein KF795_11830 [Labilithrix sp.]|nr:hypothetical protein [Labilithrix sp.]